MKQLNIMEIDAFKLYHKVEALEEGNDDIVNQLNKLTFQNIIIRGPKIVRLKIKDTEENRHGLWILLQYVTKSDVYDCLYNYIEDTHQNWIYEPSGIDITQLLVLLPNICCEINDSGKCIFNLLI